MRATERPSWRLVVSRNGEQPLALLCAASHLPAAVIAEGQVRTYDMGGSATTLEMGEAIARKL